MQRAQEKLAQAQQFYMTAQIMRQAEGSGLLQSPLAAAALAPQSPTKPVSGTLQTDGSEATQWARTQEHSLSAVAQSYMSTQNNSGTCAWPCCCDAAAYVFLLIELTPRVATQVIL